MGDIGETRRKFIMEPLDEPGREPVPEPMREEPVPVPAPELIPA